MNSYDITKSLQYDFKINKSIILFVCLCSFPMASGCTSTVDGLNSSKGNGLSHRKVKSPEKAVKGLKESNGVKIKVALGQHGDKKGGGYRTGFFRMTETSQSVDQPFEVSIGLDQSDDANVIRNSGKSLYIYALPQIEYTRVFNESGDSSKKTETVNLPDQSSDCDGYKMVLHPGNNYAINIKYSQRITIRKKSSGADFGIWGTHGGTDWQVTGAEGVGKITHVSLLPFLVGNSVTSFNYNSSVQYGPEHIVPRGEDDACKYLPHKEFF